MSASPRLARGRRRRVIVRIAREGRDGLIVSDLAGVIREEVAMTNYEELQKEAESYYGLCDRARAVGVSTSVDDPESPPTLEELRVAVEQAEAKR